MPDNIRQALKMVKYCGIATIIFGAVTGSWMGDMIDAFPFLAFGNGIGLHLRLFILFAKIHQSFLG